MRKQRKNEPNTDLEITTLLEITTTLLKLKIVWNFIISNEIYLCFVLVEHVLFK